MGLSRTDASGRQDLWMTSGGVNLGGGRSMREGERETGDT
jgi:hypothetical protein